MTTAKELRTQAQQAAERLRAARASDAPEAVQERQAELDAANSALHNATGTTVDANGAVVDGFPDQIRVEGRVSLATDVAEARLRLRDAGIDADNLDDAAVRVRDSQVQAQDTQRAVDDLISRHFPRRIIGAEPLSTEDKIDALQQIGQRELAGAVLGRNPTTLTAADLAEFERQSGHDAVIEAVLGRPLSSLNPVELAQARSALRNQEFEDRLAADRLRGTGQGPGTGGGTGTDPGPTPGPGTGTGQGTGTGGGTGTGTGGGTGAGTGTGSGTNSGSGNVDPGTDPGTDPFGDPGGTPGGDPGTDVTGGSDPPADPLPDTPDGDGDPTGGDAEGSDPPVDPLPDTPDGDGDPTGGDAEGSDDPHEPPPEQDDSSNPPPATGGGGGGGGGDTADPPPDDDEGGFDYSGPTNPSGETGDFHRDDEGNWTDDNGDPVTNPDTVASLEHEYERYQQEVEDQEDEPEPDDDEEPDDDASPEFTPDDDVDLPPELEAQLRADFARLRGPGGNGDGGDIDPVDDAVAVRDPSVQLPTHQELGQRLFGQPPSDDFAVPRTSGPTPNPGADPQGGGVTDPTDDDIGPGGTGPEDDPFDTGPVIEPPAATEEPPPEDDDADVSFLPPRTGIAGRVDDGPDLPDRIDLDP